MGTRAMYTFKDAESTHHVFVHYDGYPSGAADKIQAAITSGKVWGGTRFEADEFAAGFVAANKDDAGNVRLAKSQRQYGDIEFAYTVTQAKDGKLHVKAQSVDNWDKWTATTIFSGTLDEFFVKAESLN